MPPFSVRNPDLGPAPIGHRVERSTDYDETGNEYPDPWSYERYFDTEVFLRMPPDLRAEHAIDLVWLQADPTDSPCSWLDETTGECRHYEHRPFSCRAWPVGGHGCRAALAGARIVWRDPWYTHPDDWRNPRRPPAEIASGTPAAGTAEVDSLIGDTPVEVSDEPATVGV